MYGWEPLLPLEVAIPTWRLINWNKISTKEDLLKARMRVLERKAADVEEARRMVAKARAKVRDKVNNSNALRLCKEEFKIDDLVLTYDMIRVNDISCKAKFQAR